VTPCTSQEDIPERLFIFIKDSTKENNYHITLHLFPLVVDFDRQKPCKEERLITDADELYSLRTFLSCWGITNHDGGVQYFHSTLLH
jgi:hypothetical protein